MRNTLVAGEGWKTTRIAVTWRGLLIQNYFLHGKVAERGFLGLMPVWLNCGQMVGYTILDDTLWRVF